VAIGAAFGAAKREFAATFGVELRDGDAEEVLEGSIATKWFQNSCLGVSAIRFTKPQNRS
jgi:hypothetical protein